MELLIVDIGKDTLAGSSDCGSPRPGRIDGHAILRVCTGNLPSSRGSKDLKH